jgi:lycopene cyclase domain-containing protein
MSYTVLAGIALLLAVLTDLVLVHTKLLRRKAFWTAYAIMAGFQLIINGVLTGIPIVTYDPAAVVGLRLAYAPVEDLAFGFALILTTLSCWVALGRQKLTGSPRRRAGLPAGSAVPADRLPHRRPADDEPEPGRGR